MINYETFILIGFLNLLIHFFCAISGGMQLIMRPLMVFLGIPIQTVIATTRVSSTFTRFPSILIFNKKKLINWKLSLLFLFPSFIGGLLGAHLITLIPEDVLKKLMGIIIISMGVYLFLKKEFGLVEKKGIIPKKFKELVSVPLIIINSIIGVIVGGVGMIFDSIIISIYGTTYIQTSIIRKIATLGGAVSSTLYFLFTSFIDWKLFFVITLTGLIGAYFGTNYGLKKGNKSVRIIILTIIALSGIKLLFF